MHRLGKKNLEKQHSGPWDLWSSLAVGQPYLLLSMQKDGRKDIRRWPFKKNLQPHKTVKNFNVHVG